MIKENVKKNISDYAFLNLLSSIIVLQKKPIIFENQQLQKHLYNFYDNPDFNFLFEDICKIESIDGNNYVNLMDAFQLAYALVLLSMIQDNSNLKSVINLSEEEALKNILQFDLDKVNAMNKLVTKLYMPKKVCQNHILVKK